MPIDDPALSHLQKYFNQLIFELPSEKIDGKEYLLHTPVRTFDDWINLYIQGITGLLHKSV
jgi:hypothetical protein